MELKMVILAKMSQTQSIKFSLMCRTWKTQTPCSVRRSRICEREEGNGETRVDGGYGLSTWNV